MVLKLNPMVLCDVTRHLKIFFYVSFKPIHDWDKAKHEPEDCMSCNMRTLKYSMNYGTMEEEIGKRPNINANVIFVK